MSAFVLPAWHYSLLYGAGWQYLEEQKRVSERANVSPPTPERAVGAVDALSDVVGTLILFLFAAVWKRVRDCMQKLTDSTPREIYIVLPPTPFSTDKAPINVTGWIKAMEKYFKLLAFLRMKSFLWRKSFFLKRAACL